MSTRSVIAEPLDNGFRGRYVHMDGYPSGKVRDLIQLVQERGVAAVRDVLIHQHYSWSSIHHVPIGEVPGNPHSDTTADEWFTAADFPDSHMEWVYVLNERNLSVLRSTGTDPEHPTGLHHVADFPYTHPPTEDMIRQAECGPNYEWCSHVGWYHLGREHVGADMSMRQWLGHVPLSMHDAIAYEPYAGKQAGLSVRSMTTGNARTTDWRQVDHRKPLYYYGYTADGNRPVRLARITKAGYKLERAIVLPSTAVAVQRTVPAGTILPR